MRRLIVLSLVSVFLCGSLTYAAPRAPRVPRPPDFETTGGGIQAVGKASYFEDWVKGVRITIANNSDKPLVTYPALASFFVVTKNNGSYEIGSPTVLRPLADSLKPKARAVFYLGFGRLKFNKEDIEKIICYYDGGDTKVVLVPHPSLKK